MSALFDMLHPTVAHVRIDVVPAHHGAFHPVGVMLHHTGSKGAGLHVVQHGRPDLAGPLAHLNITRTGDVIVVCDGLAWHAGLGMATVLEHVQKGIAPTHDATQAGSVDGNPWFYGVEVDNDGAGEHYPDVQIAALVYTAAAICRHHHWTAARAIHHREWTSRKPDMSFTGNIRAEIAKHL